jgi:hypothetical protein
MLFDAMTTLQAELDFASRVWPLFFVIDWYFSS